MQSNTETLFVDTNAFLQLRDLKDIPWGDLLPGVKRVDLMVAPPVVEELDRFKNGSSDRKRKRARAALVLIDEASRNPGLTLVLRSKPVEARLVVSAAPRFDWTQSTVLDQAKPDDQLVAEAVSFGNDAAIFSCDTGPRIRARVMKLRAYEPQADWYLPEEPTDEQKINVQLKKDLALARSTKPTIIARFLNDLEAASGAIRLIKPILPPLDPQVARQLVDAHLERHPRAAPSAFRMQSPIAIDGYHASYAGFESNVRKYFESLHEKVSRQGLAVAVQYWLKNDSGTAAQGLRVEFSLDGSGSLLADRGDAPRFLGSLKLPRPPDHSPLDYAGLIMPHVSSLDDVLERHRRDPVKFYWVDRPEVVAKHGSLRCENFHATREWRDALFVMPAGEFPVTLDLGLHVGADNLTSPVDLAAKIMISEEPSNWSDAFVQSILPEAFRGRVS